MLTDLGTSVLIPKVANFFVSWAADFENSTFFIIHSNPHVLESCKVNYSRQMTSKAVKDLAIVTSRNHQSSVGSKSCCDL